jgi:hypothetical protein
MPGEGPGILAVRAGGAPDLVLKVSENWFDHLIAAVVQAPENHVRASSLVYDPDREKGM